MILPSKHGDVDRSPFVLGAHILQLLDEPNDIGSLWVEVRERSFARSFNRFYNTIILLHIIGAVDTLDGLLVRMESE